MSRYRLATARTRFTAAAVALTAVGVALVLGTLSVTSARATPSVQTQGAGTFVWGQPVEASGGLDPAKSFSGATWWLWAVVYDTLVKTDGLKLVPGVAASWQRTTPTTYVFTLRRDVRFSNGRQLTAEDVVGTLRRALDQENANILKGQLGQVLSVSANGRWKVTVRLAAPRPGFLAALASPPASILPMRELRAGSFDPSERLLGSGPFKVDAHSQNESWTLSRNQHYWRKTSSNVRRLVVRVMPDDAARIAALRTGTIHGTFFDNPDVSRLLRNQRNARVVVPGSTDFYVLDLNNSASSVLRDERVRRAVSMSIDRRNLVGLALGGVGRSTAVVAPAFGQICTPPSAGANLDAARQLISAADANGTSVSIVIYAEYPAHRLIAQVLQQNLRAIGLNASVVQQDAGTVGDRIYAGKADFDLHVSWYYGWADPATVLTWWNPAIAGGWNEAWLGSDAKLNTFIAKSQGTNPGAARKRALVGACKRVAETANMIPLVTKETPVAFRTDKVVARFPSAEGFGVYLRYVDQFRLR